MLTSGIHELFGTLRFDVDAASALEAWLGVQSFANEYDERDARGWVAEVCAIEGSTARLYESTRTSYPRVEVVRGFVEHLAGSAAEGRVVLQHVENGVRILEWQVRGGRATFAEKMAKRRRPVPPEYDAVRARLEQVIDENTRRWNARAPSARFDEVMVRHVPKMPAILLVNGTEERRAAALQRILGAIPTRPAPWSGGGPLPSGAVHVAEDLTCLSSADQVALTEALREREVGVVVAWTRESPNGALAAGLNDALYFRLSVGQIDLDEVFP